MFKPILPLGAVALAAAVAITATPALADDTQAWGTANVTVALSGPWRINNETVVRTGNARGLYEVENNLLLGYRKGKVTVSAGYTHDPQYLHGKFTVMEHRVRTQVQADNFATVGPVRFTGRLRLEARWREGVAGTGWRLRPFLRASTPIHGKTMLNVSAEPFIDLGRTPFQRVDGMERDRAQISISTPLSKRISIEAGYLNQHSFIRRGPDNDDHVAVVSLSANF